MGLEVAQILQDEKHKSLYIKLAREHGGEKIMRLAKDVADRKAIRNKGAYFMKVLASETAAAGAAAVAANTKPTPISAPKK